MIPFPFRVQPCPVPATSCPVNQQNRPSRARPEEGPTTDFMSHDQGPGPNEVRYWGPTRTRTLPTPELPTSYPQLINSLSTPGRTTPALCRVSQRNGRSCGVWSYNEDYRTHDPRPCSRRKVHPPRTTAPRPDCVAWRTAETPQRQSKATASREEIHVGR